MRTVATLIFPEFEMLDVFGPLQMFGMLPEEFELHMVAQHEDPVACAQGPRTVVDHGLKRTSFDMILVPGGAGTRREIRNTEVLDWIRAAAATAEVVMSVCTGSVLLAAAKTLDGRCATTNKRAFEWVRSQAPHVDWVRRARWVEDGNVFTASGVSAGIDMSLAVISRLCGRKAANQVCIWAEYVWEDDPTRDPFCDTQASS